MCKIFKRVFILMACCAMIFSLSGCGEKKIKEVSINASAMSDNIINGMKFKNIKTTERYIYSEDKQKLSYVKGEVKLSVNELISAMKLKDLSNSDKIRLISQTVYILDEGFNKLEQELKYDGGSCKLSATLSDDGGSIVLKYKYDKKCLKSLVKKIKKQNNQNEQVKLLKKIIKSNPEKCVKILKDVIKEKNTKAKFKIKKVYY